MRPSVTLETDEWNAVLVLLAEAPYKTVFPLIHKIREQVAVQLDNRAQESKATNKEAKSD